MNKNTITNPTTHKKDVTVIIPDNLIIVEGRGLSFPFTLPEALPKTLHALQWHSEKGELEYLELDIKNNRELPGNLLFNTDKYDTYVKPFVDLWEVQREIEDNPPVIEIPLATLKKNKKNEAKTTFDTFSKALVEFYADMEIASFYKQELDAQKFKANPQIDLALIPYIVAIAQNREVPLALLADKILEKSNQIAPINGALLGKKQRIEDLVDACVSSYEVGGIHVRDVLNAGLAVFGIIINEQNELGAMV